MNRPRLSWRTARANARPSETSWRRRRVVSHANDRISAAKIAMAPDHLTENAQASAMPAANRHGPRDEEGAAERDPAREPPRPPEREGNGGSGAGGNDPLGVAQRLRAIVG